MKTRQEILLEAKRIVEEIAQIITDCEHWNNSVRPPGEDPIEVDADGQMARHTASLDALIAKEEGWHVYRMNDCEWWLARSPEEAVTAFQAAYGDDPTLLELPVTRLSELELCRMLYSEVDGAGDEQDSGTFRGELDLRIQMGPTVEMFATTEMG